ncbi:MAG: 4Fe-4S binding protein [Thermoguttaceae bacterium]|nr:4Fe-4S binding protein [Thermoguttaceae bacterium]MDW8079018.1 4Fe-4S binding protein [Thermoguttaceae bacterium]
MPAVVDLNKCSGCGDCRQACPTGAIEIVDGKAKIDESTCADCGACVDVCPTGAISLP